MLISFKKKRYHRLTDEQLVELIATSHDSLAFEILHDRYSSLVLGVCLKYTQNETVATDLTAEIMSSLADKVSKHTIHHFKSWLYQVTKNTCFQYHRSRKALFVPIDATHIALDDDAPHELQELRLSALEQALNELKKEQAICVRLFYLECKSYIEISGQLGISLNAVKSAIQNGKRNLKLLMLKNDEIFPQ